MATFGVTTNNGSTQTFSGDRMYLSTASPASSGTITAGKGRCSVSAGGSTVARIVIYADVAGSPDGGAFLALSDEVTITGSTETEYTFNFSGVNQIYVTSGTPYWFGFFFDDPGTPNFVMSRANTAGQVYYSAITYPTAPSTFTSGGAPANGPHDVYIEYTPGPPPASVGGAMISQFLLGNI